jgi:S1-C subfamily serine protease
MLNRILVTIIALCWASIAAAQVLPPKHESRFHHLFASHRDTENLQQRFEAIRCALVLVESGPTLGTGFYINGDGDFATASHVIGQRTFALNADSTIQVSIAMPRILTITNSRGERVEVPSASAVEQNADAWLADIARVKTGRKTDCWLQEADDQQSRPGEHLITMGFPGLSFQTLTLYVGIMSARLKGQAHLPIAILNGQNAILPSNEFIRVQMPISTGLSGAPVIDDENRAVGVITNAGGWTQDLDNLMLAFRGGAFPTPPAPPSQPNSVSFGLNSMALMAQLAGLFHDYASPGYGDAVALRYLKKPPQQNQPSASQSH